MKPGSTPVNALVGTEASALTSCRKAGQAHCLHSTGATALCYQQALSTPGWRGPEAKVPQMSLTQHKNLSNRSTRF